MSSTCFVFCHGFGFDATYWNPLRDYFAKEHTLYWDAQYFTSEPPFDLSTNFSTATEYIGIGHSLGFLHLLQQALPFKALIGLNGFTHFLGHDKSLHRSRQRELRFLKQALQHEPTHALQRFYARCGLKRKAPNALKIERLMADFKHLESPCIEIPEVPMLILGAVNDIIVPPEVIEDNFSSYSNVRIEMMENGQHGLGHVHSAYVHQRIMSFVYAGV